MFPAPWARRHARERLGIEADEIDGGHYITLSRPLELAEQLASYVAPSEPRRRLQQSVPVSSSDCYATQRS